MMKNKLGLISLLWITKTFAVGEEGRLMKDPLCPTSAIQYTGGTLLSGTMVRDVDGERVEDFLTDLSMKIAPNAVAKKRIKSVTLNDFVSKIEAVSQSVGSMTASALKRALKQIPDPQHLKAQVAQQNRRLDEGSASLLSGVTGVGSKLKAIPTPENRLVDQLKECLEEIDGVESGSLESKLNALHALLGMEEDQSVADNLSTAIASLRPGETSLKNAIDNYTVSDLAEKIQATASVVEAARAAYLAELGSTGRTLSEQTQYFVQALGDPGAQSLKDLIERLRSKISYGAADRLQDRLEELLQERYDNSAAAIGATAAQSFDGRIQALIASTIDVAYIVGSRSATLRGKLQEQLNLIAPGASSLKAALTTIANSVGTSYASLTEGNSLRAQILALARKLGDSTAASQATILIGTGVATAAYNQVTAITGDSGPSIESILRAQMAEIGRGETYEDAIKSLIRVSNLETNPYKMASNDGLTAIRGVSGDLNGTLNTLTAANLTVPPTPSLTGYGDSLILAYKTLCGAAGGTAATGVQIPAVLGVYNRLGSLVRITDTAASAIVADTNIIDIFNELLILGGYS
jgi:hypothetical protein